MLPNNPAQSDFGPIHIIPLRIPHVYIDGTHQVTMIITYMLSIVYHSFFTYSAQVFARVL
jgi:hypothetical protein